MREKIYKNRHATILSKQEERERKVGTSADYDVGGRIRRREGVRGEEKQ